MDLFYVRDEENQQDLLVRCEDSLCALKLWIAHYTLDDDAVPTYIGTIPPDKYGALDWGPILQNAIRY